MESAVLLSLRVAATRCDANLTVSDLAVAIISGKELLSTRVLAQARSWFPTFRSVSVYSDSFPNPTVADISAAAPHASVRFVAVAGRAEHITGSQWVLPWYSAQPRFLPALHDLWRAHPAARWFVVGDDDTYLYPRNILRRLGKHYSAAFEVVSYFWCTWDSITEFMEPVRDCHPFAQGGSGVLFSRAVMDVIGPRLLACSRMYNDAEHAASMRISVCMERTFGYENWTKLAFVKPWRSGIHPSAPRITIGFGNTWDPPGSFHQVTPDEMLRLKGAHLCDAVGGFWDFARFTFRTVALRLTYARWWQLHFGYCIDSFATHSMRLLALSPIATPDGGATFVQRFEGNVSVTVVCDRDVPEDVIDVEEVERGPTTRVSLRLDCPEKTPYYN
jgi:hypothetical protein